MPFHRSFSTLALLLPVVSLLFLSPLLTTPASAQLTFQFGTVEATHLWQTVNFDSSISNPLVFAGPASYRETTAVLVQVRDVTSSTFTIRVREESVAVTAHAAETVSWMVVATGQHSINGIPFLAGLQAATTSHLRGGAWDTIGFSALAPLSQTPLVLTMAQTLGTDEIFNIRKRNIDISGNTFQLATERNENVNNNPHTPLEDVAWFVMERGTAGELFGGIQRVIEIVITPNSVTHSPYAITFSNISPQTTLSLAIAQQQTTDGGNTAWTRSVGIVDNVLTVFVEEEQTQDSEVSHTTEIIGALALSCSVPSLEDPEDTFSNAQHFAFCPFLFFSFIPGEYPWVEITADFDVGGVIADVYLRSTVAPNLVDFDAADTTRSSQSTVVALVNPDKDLAFVGIYRPDDAYTVTLSRRVPNAPLIPLGYYDTVDAEHEWATFKFNTDAQYQTLFVTAESNSGAPLQMYIQAGSMATIDKFEFSTLAPKVGETFYEIPLTLPTQLTDYFISVYVPSAPTDTITVRIMPAEPVINSLDPSFDETLGASTFRISGTNLGTGIDTIVQFGSVLCNPPYTYTSTEITCVIPPGQGTDKLVNVTHYGVTSASRKFNYDPPDITSVTVDGFPSGLMPTRGGTELILAGKSFGLSGTVFIDSTPCTLVPGSYGHREVRCVSPEGQGEGLLLSLVVGGQESNLKTISYQTPVLESIDPTSGPTSGNVDIVLYGSNFGTGGETTVEIGSKLCPIVEQTHDNITCTLPAGAGANLLISVRVASQTGSNPNGIVFAYDLPAISEITPNTTLTDGGEIVITGSNFGASTGTVPVGGSGATCSPTAWDHTEITCTIPPGQGAGLDLSVTVAQSQLSNIVSFSYLPPTITSVTPEAIPTRGGQLFTIRGTSLGIAETSVSANSQGCTIPAGSQYHNHTHILCVSREGQGKDLPIYVVVGLQQSNELEFSYTPPAITEILPSNGTTIGSTLVQLTGTNFGSSGSTNRIVFGVQEALCSVNSEQYSHELIQCLTPAGQGTDQDVVVIAGGQRSDPVSFNYNPPQITGMNPAVISTAGEVEVDVNGLNLGVASKVFFNSVPCPLTASGQSHTRLTCTAPEGRGTSVNVTVVVADQSDTSFAFSYAAPTISQVTAVAGAFSTSGNVLLSISGSSFDTDGTVFIGSSRCDAALTGSGYDHDAILCGLPEGQGTGIPVIVQTVDQRNSTAVLIQYDAPNVEQYSTLNDEAPTDGGITLTIEGTNFGKSTPIVTVGGESCPVTSHSHILIECDLPPGEGQTNAIVVTAGGQPSTNSPNFAYDGPKIFALVPPGGLTDGGYNLTIVGSDFGRLGSATAKVGEEDCPILTQNTTHVICQVPEGSGNELVRVTVDTTTSTGFTFAYDAPTISTVSPQLGRTDGGDILTLHGSSFGRGVTIIVLVGGLSCGVTSHNHSTVLCTTPKGTGSEKLVIMTVDQKPSDPGTFGYLPPSLLVDGSGISPGNGPTVGGTTLVLQGANFGVRPKASVTVGTKGCTITTFTSTRIECSTAESQGADLNVTVTVDSQVSNKLRFSYDAPNITEIIPQGGETSGENDYAITLNGANFGTEGDVLVGGKPCTTLTASQYNQDQIICSLPEGQDFVNVTVTVGGQVSEPSLYRYATPQIFAFSPTNGPTDGLVTLTVSGRDFGTSGQLTIGDRPCSVANLGTDGIYDHGRIECEIPSGAGIDQLVRIDVGSQSYTADPVKFDYDAPVLDLVEPNNGPTQGNVSVTVRGSNFGVEGELIIEIDGQRCNATERSHDEVICTLPAGSGASRPVQVFVQDQSSARRTDLFRYAAPQILNISSPDCVDVFAEATTIKCKTDATSLLTIYGNNFGPAGVATIDIPGDPECVTLQNDANDPHHILYCELSASIGFDIPIEVVVNGAQSNTKFISYSGPLIYSGTLRVVGRAITSNPNHANLSSVDGGDVVEFRGEFLRRTDPPTVRYGQSGSDPLEYACDVIFASKEFINCTIAAGMGRDLVFQVNDGLQTSLSSDDTVTYPRPVIFPNTIRTTTSQRSDSVSGALSEGDFILFDVTNITNDASKLSVRYGLPGSDYPFACNQVSVVVSATNTSIQCRTSPGEGRGYVFVLVALNYPSLPGTDVYEYPQAPIVIGVRGCDDGDGVEFSANGTINCPTSGNRLLSITGSSFSELASVKIGINDCLNVDQVNSKLITCTLPVGTGLRLPVVVASGLLFSRSKPFVSYALPTLTSVSGCAEDDGLDTAGCNRFGGDTIVIDGDNLGVSGATVLIGGENCDQVEHDADTPHQRVTCRTPAGARTNRAVILLQSRGELSNQRFIAYSQCPAGTYDSSNSTYIDRPCTNCTAGTFSSVFGSLSCTNCEDGFFAEDERSTSCQRCPKGSFSTGQNGVGPTFCTQCPIGTFTNTDGQGACIDCPAGTFSNALGRTTCADCPKGTQNPDDGQSECTNCTAGKFASSKGTLTCSFCPLGRFSDSIRAEVCTQCEPGKFAPSVGAQGCTKCPLGRAIAAVGQFACLACDSGYFANDTGLDVCLTCPPGSISLKDPTPGSAGPDECSLCEAGSYIGVSAQATCLKCSKGSFSSDSGFVACDPCDLGQYADAIGLSECFNCSEGTIAPTEGTVSCEDCPAGSFAAGVKQSACVLCDAGRYQPNPAEGACLPCPVGEAQSSVGQPNCKQCDVGLFADTPATVTCSRCEPGFIAESQGSTGCEPCEPGEFSDSEAQGFCKDCAAGSISTEYNSTACTRCPIGSIAASAGLSQCTNCSAGFFSPAVGGQACERCEKGSFAPRPGLGACTACPVGKAQPLTSQPACASCAAGKFTGSIGQADCKQCQPGTFSNVSTSSFCYECAPGTYQGASDKSVCELCPVGRFNPSSGQPSCTACPVGKYANVEGLEQCIACDEGKFASVQESVVCTNCTAGKFAESKDTQLCTACEPGTYTPRDGMQRCLACEPGRYQPDTNKVECIICDVGKVQSATGQARCIDCAVGQYQPEKGKVACLDCPAGKITSRVARSVCTNCTQGTFAASEGSFTCPLCPVGRFASRDGLSSCTACPAGSFQGLSGQSECEECPAGEFTSFPGQSRCEPCSAGSYANGTGLDKCTSCERGRFSDARAGLCTPCVAGRFASVRGLDTCVDCPVGSFAAQSGQSFCQSCSPGKFASSARSTKCTDCVAGRAASGNGTQLCTVCGQGSFSPEDGSTSCTDCEAGKFQNSEGETQCIPCSVGEFAPATGQPLCSPCSIGFFAEEESSSACDPCPMGSAQPSEGASACIDCRIGAAIGVEGQALCKECDAGFFANETGTVECTPCPLGKFSTKHATTGRGAVECVACAPGRFTSAIGQPSCLPCEFGTFGLVSGLSSCSACPAGRSVDFSAAVECVDCDPGSFSNDGAVTCSLCAPGRFMPNSSATECDVCPSGKFRDFAGATDCQDCAAGRFVTVTESLQCEKCPLGRAVSVNGSSVCDECVPGRFQSDVGQLACDQCPRGKFAVISGASECQSCPAGSFNNITDQDECFPCLEGTATNELGATRCPECPIGRAILATGQTSCRFCSAGRFANVTGMTGCTACPKGSFQSAQGNETCVLCPAGRFQDSLGQSECKLCPAGTTANETGSTTCRQCLPGFFQEKQEQLECDECPPGRFTSVSGRTTCRQCQPGFVQPSNRSTECIPCDSGDFQPLPGQEACDPCPAGTFTSGGGDTCIDCPTGRFQNVSQASDCIDCPAGWFQAQRGQEECDECPPGEYSPVARQSRCSQCEPGHFTPFNGTIRCSECDAGKLQAFSGGTTCRNCSAGTFTSADGLSACDICEPGRFSPTPGQTRCTQCIAGQFQQFSGGIKCTNCSAGTYNAVEGQSFCFDCERGKRNDRNGSTECVDCEAGWYLGGEGETGCERCPVGRFAPVEGRFECDECDKGRFANETGSSVCFACDEGKKQGSFGETTCDFCDPGRYARATASVACTPCDAGEYAPNQGMSVCLDCPAGRAQDRIGRDECTVCQPGSAAVSGSAECSPCTFRSVAPLEGTRECTDCPQDADTLDQEYCRCRKGFFSRRVANSTNVALVECISCPEGARCDSPGVEWETLETEEGWWRASNDSLVFYRCLIKSHCASGRASQEGSPCLGNRDGPICASCKEGYQATSMTAECTPCPSRQKALVSSVIVSIVIVLALIFMYWVVLRSDRSLMDDAKRNAEAKRANEWAWFEEDEDQFMRTQKQAVFRRAEDGGQGEEIPNFTYKMKIILGFFQITTNLALALDAPWPTRYQEFISVFSLVNFDFISWSSVTCVVETNFYTQFWALTLTPLIVFVLVFIFYLVPRYVMYVRVEENYDLLQAARKREVRQFWKLLLFTLFLIYPGVSSTVMRVYVCREINDRKYLLADFSVECGGANWTKHAYIAIGFVLVYPIGIPVFFWWMMRSNLGKLNHPDVRVQLGFLYEAYSASLWWFELPDMANKLFLTSIVAFFEQTWQLPIAMVWAIGYLIVLLWLNPYVRGGDDRLHLFAQTEIFLLILVAYIFVNGEDFNENSDAALSGVMIVVILGIMLLFLGQVGRAVVRVVRARLDMAEKIQDAGEGEAVSDSDIEGGDTVRDEATATSVVELRLPKDALMIRNPLFGSSTALLDGVGTYDDEDSESDDDVSVSKGRMGAISEAYRAGGIAGSPKSGNGQHKQVIEMAQQRKQSMRDLLGVEVDANSKVGNGGSKRRSESDNSSNRSERSEPDDDGDDDGERVGLGEGLVRSSSAGPVSTNDQVPEETNGLMRRAPKKVNKLGLAPDSLYAQLMGKKDKVEEVVDDEVEVSDDEVDVSDDEVADDGGEAGGAPETGVVQVQQDVIGGVGGGGEGGGGEGGTGGGTGTGSVPWMQPVAAMSDGEEEEPETGSSFTRTFGARKPRRRFD